MAPKGDRKGRPYRRVPTLTPVADRNGTQGRPQGSPLQARVPTMTPKGDPVGAPLAGAPDDTQGLYGRVMHQEDASVSLLYPIHWIGPFARRVGQTLTQILSLLFDFQRAKSRLR